MLEDAIVETYGSIDAAGAQAYAFGALPAAVHDLVERHVHVQELTVRAALSGDRGLALQAFLNDPFTSRLPADEVEKMMNELLEANRAYLPLFFE